MWHVYNLISEVCPTRSSFTSFPPDISYDQGDEVRALALRRVQTVSSTGSSDSYRVRVNLNLSVTKVGHGSEDVACN